MPVLEEGPAACACLVPGGQKLLVVAFFEIQVNDHFDKLAIQTEFPEFPRNSFGCA